MDRVVLVLGAVAIAGLVAVLVGRRRPVPTNPPARIPGQLDRRDFDRPDTPWLMAVFTADSCSTCTGVWRAARELGGPRVVVQQLEASRDVVVHRRYGIDFVPILLIADERGVVLKSFLGPVDAAELRAALSSVTT